MPKFNWRLTPGARACTVEKWQTLTGKKQSFQSVLWPLRAFTCSPLANTASRESSRMLKRVSNKCRYFPLRREYTRARATSCEGASRSVFESAEQPFFTRRLRVRCSDQNTGCYKLLAYIDPGTPLDNRLHTALLSVEEQLTSQNTTFFHGRRANLVGRLRTVEELESISERAS
jgi:hypothetical protein